MSWAAVILAGGRGSRAGRAKQFERAGQWTLLTHACFPFQRSPRVSGIVVVCPLDAHEAMRLELAAAGITKLKAVVAGGDTRHLSSRAGLQAVPSHFDVVLIHDAARPFVTTMMIERVGKAAVERGAAVPAIPVTDSLLSVDSDGSDVEEYLDRARVRSVQTPQGFRRPVIEAAFAAAQSNGYTDDAWCVREMGEPVAVVEGETGNRKITSSHELAAALNELAKRDK